MQVVLRPDDPQYAPSRRVKSDYFIVPLLTVQEVQSTYESPHYTLTLTTKDGREVVIGFLERDWEDYHLLLLIRNYAFPSDIRQRFAFSHVLDARVNGWRVYNPQQEYARFGVIEDCLASAWVFADNYSGEICDTYPDKFVVPKALSHTEILEVASFRTKRRLPVLVWAHPKQISTLWRSSQPKVRD